MTSGQSVGILGRIGVWRVIALVCGHQTQAMIYFQRVRIIDNLDTFAYILFRYAVMVKPEGDIAVTHYCCGASLFHLMAYGGKRAEAVGLNLLELFPSGLGTPAHPASVEGRERFGYGRIQRLQRVEYKTLDVSVDGNAEGILLGNANYNEYEDNKVNYNYNTQPDYKLTVITLVDKSITDIKTEVSKNGLD